MDKEQRPQLIQFTPEEKQALDLLENAYFDMFASLDLNEVELKSLKEKTAELHRARDPIVEKASKRTIATYQGDTARIYNDLAAAVESMIDETMAAPISMAGNDREMILKMIIEAPTRAYKYFFDYLETGAPELHEKINDYIMQKAAAAIGLIQEIKPESINTVFPKYFTAALDKVTDKTFSNQLTESFTALKMEGKNQPRITTYAKIIYDGLEGITANLSAFDKSVYNAINSLYEAGQREVTNQMIYRVMKGDNKARLSPNKAAEINESVHRCAGKIIHIDARQEITVGKYKNLDPEYVGNLLTIEGKLITLNGTRCSCYQITTPPMLYRYAKGKGQIGSCPINVLNVPINMTDEAITIRDYLLEWIMALKNPKNGQLNNERTYEKIYDRFIMDQVDLKDKKRKIRDQVKKILEHWKTENYIADYEEIKKGRTLHKVKVIIH